MKNKFIKEREGFWSAEKLERQTPEEIKLENGDICVCGHPKYMHAEGLFKNERGHCKTHGCRHDGAGCMRFKKARMRRKVLNNTELE